VPAAIAPQAGFDKLHVSPLFAPSFVTVAVSATAPWCANSVTALAGAVIATATASTVIVVTDVWWLLIVEAAVIVAVQLPLSTEGGVYVAVRPLDANVPQFAGATFGRAAFFLIPATLLVKL
jgi:hypothetical protein